MATTTFTADGEQKTFAELVCSAALTSGRHGQLTFLSVLNIFLSITAFLGNALILAALRKESSLHPPSKLLLRSLATTDLCVGLISQPLAAIFFISVVNEAWNICLYVSVASLITSSFLCGVSVFTLAAISVDRLLALLLGLRYRQVVTLKRTYVIVITFWVVLAVYSIAYFLNPFIFSSFMLFKYILLSLVTSIFSYTTIFHYLRYHQNRVQDLQQNEANQLNIARYRKAVSTALWLQLSLVACYLPLTVVMALFNSSGLTSSLFLARQYAITIVFLNSSLNPILYCWKIEEVIQAVVRTQSDKYFPVHLYLFKQICMSIGAITFNLTFLTRGYLS